MSATIEKTKTIYLDKPIEFNGGKYEQLDLREPIISEKIKALTHKDFDTQTVYLISFVSGWPVPAVLMLGVTVINEAAAFLYPLLAHGLPTGEKSESL